MKEWVLNIEGKLLSQNELELSYYENRKFSSFIKEL